VKTGRLIPVLTLAVSTLGQTWVQWPVLEGGNGHWYGLTRRAYAGWGQAEAEAQSCSSGHLVSVNSLAEQKFLEATFLSGHSVSNAYWIGFSDFAQEGRWVWSTGEPPTFTYWHHDEPNNDDIAEGGGVINWHYACGDGGFGEWNDFYENREVHRGIVEVQSSAPPCQVEVVPWNQTVSPGSSAGLRACLYTLGAGLRYQWQFNGATIPGATNDTLSLTNLTRSQSGDYTVTVSTPGQSLRSEPARLTVRGLPVITTQPVSRVVTEGQEAEFSVVVSGEGPFTYEWLFNGAPMLGASQPTLALPNVKTTQTGNYSVRVSNPDGPTLSTSAKLTVLPEGFTVVYAEDFEEVVGSEWSNKKTSRTPTAGRQFLGELCNDAVRLRLQSVGNHNRLLLAFDLLLVRSWDGYADVWTLTEGASNTVLRTTFSTYQYQEGEMDQAFPSSLGLGRFPADTGAAETSTLGYDRWWPGSSDAVYVMGFVLQHTNSTVDLLFGASGLQNIADESWGLDNVVIAVATTLPGSAPEILAPPGSQVVRGGKTAVFKVLASGSPPLRYQWRFAGADIAGATNDVLTVKDAKPSDAGRYSVIVENDFGLISRSPAELAVVSEEPIGQTVTAGETATFSVALSGAASVRWRFNGADLPGQTQTSLVLNAIVPEQAGAYAAVVSNGGKPLLTRVALLSAPLPGQPGSKVWECDIDGWWNLHSTPAVAPNGTVYVAAAGKLRAIKPGGAEQWSVSLPILYSSPSVGPDGTVYVGGWGENRLFAVRPDGTRKWDFATGGRFTAGPAIAADGAIYAGETVDFATTDPHRLHIVRPDGAKKWDYVVFGRISSAPAIGADGTAYFGVRETNKLYAVSAAGGLKWTLELFGGWVNGSPAIGGDGTVYFGSSEGRLYAVQPDGKIRWALVAGASIACSPAVGPDGTVYFTSCENGKLFAVKPDGSLQWSQDLGEFCYGSPAVDSAGAIYVPLEGTIGSAAASRLIAFKQNGEKLWEFSTGGLAYHPYEGRRPQPVIGADGTLYFGALLPGGKAKLYAIRTGTTTAPEAPWPMPGRDAQHTGRMPLGLEATNLNVSVGANVVMRAVTSEQPPVRFQWYRNGIGIPRQTNVVLNLANVAASQAGYYRVVMTYANGASRSQAVMLLVDATFTKITIGPVVTDVGDSVGVAWADYDGDGWEDLFVANSSMQPDFLYHNNRDGAFARITNALPALAPGESMMGSWADYDNDGRLDLFVTHYSQSNNLFRGDGKGGFEKILTGSVVNDAGHSYGAAWGDYDQDGNLDLAVINSDAQQNFLYQNNGDGTFARVTSGSVVSEPGHHISATWADYDNDGDPDLFVTTRNADRRNLLFRNDRGKFTKITTGPVVTDSGLWGGACWGDFDNDGDLDLFVACAGQPSRLYRNEGAGIFTRVAAGELTADIGDSLGAAWADYDNDGYLDLLVTNLGFLGNWLYRNNGDGTFARITDGSVAHDLAHSHGAAWADCDQNGFLDLVVVNRTFQGRPATGNFLYRNNGNTYRWLKLRLVGTLSNTSAIGAKVRVKATIHGREMWQLREISGGTGFCAQNALGAHFGLGDAATIEVLRVEWPSGIAQEFEGVAASQFLTITEPPVLTVGLPQLDGSFELILTSRGGFNYGLDTSEDLRQWRRIGALTNVRGSVQFVDTEARLHKCRFYRAVQVQ
jgi:hypothetical protein